MKRSFGLAAAAIVLMAGSVGASVKPVLLKNFNELRAVFQYLFLPRGGGALK